jgi:hypothetical protein
MSYKYKRLFIPKGINIKTTTQRSKMMTCRKIVVLKVVPPWFVHGCSMVPPSKTPKSMDKPWRNHGGTMDKPFI